MFASLALPASSSLRDGLSNPSSIDELKACSMFAHPLLVAGAEVCHLYPPFGKKEHSCTSGGILCPSIQLALVWPKLR